MPLRANFINVKITIFSEKSQNNGQNGTPRRKALRGVFAFGGNAADGFREEDYLPDCSAHFFIMESTAHREMFKARSVSLLLEPPISIWRAFSRTPGL